MKIIGLAVTLVLGAAAALGGAPALAAGKTYDFAPVTAYMDAGYKSLGLPGASLLVVKDGHTIYEQYFGTYKPETVVPIASSSKWLSAAVIMTLVDEGKIDLNAPVSKYLPQFTGRMAKITIRQMFSHSSGLVDFPGPWNYSMTMAEYADKVAREGIMKADPGTEIRYASASMQVVGAVAEKVTGKTWNELFIERIGKPCDMPDTAYVKTPDNHNPILAGNAHSTLHDYGHFLEMIANNGVYKGRRVISEKSIREMQKDQTGAEPLVTASNDRMGRKSHYGIGEWVDVQAPDGRTVQVSSPGAFGFRPWLNLDRHLYGVFMMQRAPGGPAMNDTFDPWKLIDMVHEAADRGK